jgi:hypothetical protein
MTHRRSVTAARLLAAPLLLAAVACGNDGSGSPQASPSSTAPSPSPTTPSPTPTGMDKAAFVKQFNAICGEVNDATDKIQEPKNADDYHQALVVVHESLEAGQKKLRALEPPAADKADVEEYLDVNDQQIAMLEEYLPKAKAAADKDDKSAAEKVFGEVIVKFGTLGAEQEEWADDYGLKECTEG